MGAVFFLVFVVIIGVVFFCVATLITGFILGHVYKKKKSEASIKRTIYYVESDGNRHLPNPCNNH